MKKANAIVLLISMIVILSIAVLVVLAVLGGTKLSKDYAGNAQKLGFSVENTGRNEFCVENESVKFYYKKTLFGLKFTKYEFHMEKGKGLMEDSREADIKVKVRHFSKLKVSADTEGAHLSFNCDEDFNSLETQSTDPTGNRRDAYEYLTSHYYSQEQFRSTYETAIAIRNQIADK